MINKFKNVFFYILTIGIFSSLIYFIIVKGKILEAGKSIQAHTSDKSQWQEFLESFSHNLRHPLALLLLQIITIVLVARLFGWVCKKIGQPTVVGEMLAGILLGPSFIGMYFPEFSEILFPVQSLGNLQFLSQVGLILFMYIVGMEVDLKVLRTQAHDAVVISHSSIIFPFFLGFALAYFLYSAYAPVTSDFLSFSLFIGIAMSITAFPVLARIVQERNIQKTKLGTIVITCAAVDDITAWCVLAAVIAIVKAGSFGSSVFVILLAIGYVLFMIKIVRPFLKRISDLYPNKESLTKPIIAIFFLILILSSYLTEIIGIHALFGAFMAGAIMPDKIKFRELFIEKVEDVSMILFLPLFFVFTGLRTEIGLINDIELWKVTGWIILIAVCGKFLGSALAAKFVGQSWKDSLTIGALMNTRGLMELVVLNIGYDLGVLSPEIFSMMVLMALVTTFMTGPAIDLVNWLFKSKPGKNPVSEGPANKSSYKILIPFTNPNKGKNLLRMANGLLKEHNENNIITTLHLANPDQIHNFLTDEYEKEYFKPIMLEARRLHQKILTLSKASVNASSELLEVIREGEYDFILVGIQQSIYEGSILGKILGFTTRIFDPEKLVNKIKKGNFLAKDVFDEQLHALINKSTIPVGIYVDKKLFEIKKIIIPVFSNTDLFILNYGSQLAKNTHASIEIADSKNQDASLVGDWIQSLENDVTTAVHITVSSKIQFNDKESSLLLISLDSWEHVLEQDGKLLKSFPSTLIIHEPVRASENS